MLCGKVLYLTEVNWLGSERAQLGKGEGEDSLVHTALFVHWES